MQQNCRLAGLGILPFSGHFGGKFSTPTIPAVHSIPWLSLSPYQRLTWERFWPLEIFFHFFSSFWCMVTWPSQAPRDQISPPWSRPWGHPFVISVFSLLLGIHALGFITQCIAKVNLLLYVTQLLQEVTRIGFGHFQPCLEIALYMFLCSRIAHWRGLSMAKMGFCPFLGIFCHLGVYSQPPRAQQFLLSLKSPPTLPVND